MSDTRTGMDFAECELALRTAPPSTPHEPVNTSTPEFSRPRSTSLLLAASAGLILSVRPASAAEPAAGTAPPPPPQRMHLLTQFEFSDKYLTPRGMIVHNDGLTFQWLALGLFNIYKGDSFINDVTMVGGVWQDFSTDGVSVHPPFGTKPTTKYVEIDPIAGISLGLPKGFKLDVTYTAFAMQILDIGTSHHLETKLSFDDTPYLKGFAMHPYFLLWNELSGKATAARVPYVVNPLGKAPRSSPKASHYFEFGVAPSYTFQKLGLKLELPSRVLLPDKDFYGEYYDKSSTVGLYETGVKASIPIKFVPQGYGFWNFHVGFRYMNFVDDNLSGMQQFNAPGRSVDQTVQYYCGLSAFF